MFCFRIIVIEYSTAKTATELDTLISSKQSFGLKQGTREITRLDIIMQPLIQHMFYTNHRLLFQFV